MGPRRHRRPGSGTGVALLIVLTACQPAPPAVPPSGAGTPTVIDGDSMRVSTGDGELEIRLDGVNAPEADECLAEEARARLQELAGATVAIESTGIDQFGRTLALVRNDSLLLNESMVAEGLAIATSDGPSSDRLVAAESRARSAGSGIWDPSACGPEVDAEIRIEFSQPNPPGPDDPEAEHVTLLNDGSSQVDLSGFVIRDESSSNRLPVPDGTVLAPGDSLTVWTGCARPTGIGWCSDTPIWNNGGDSALLLSPTGNIVAHARYDPDR